MPVFNSSSYLKECLDSIIQQAEKNWELLVVDDFSTDHSLLLLEQYARDDARIKVFRNQKKGIIPALRLAYQNSKGQLITRMDSDDRMHPDKLGALKTQLLTQGKGHLATAWVEYFSAEPLGAGYQRYQSWLNQLTKTANNFSEIYRECVIPSPCWMCFREDLEAAGAFRPDTYPEDYDLCFRFYQQQLKVLGISKVLHYWRDYPERSSRNDPHYADHNYLDLKMYYFLKLDRQNSFPLVLWGCGKKGKHLARLLQAAGVLFHWITNNPKKIGKQIYGITIEHFQHLKELPSYQLILSVAAPGDQQDIFQQLNDQSLQKGVTLFPFC